MFRYVGCLALTMAMLLPQEALAQKKDAPPAETPTFHTGVNLIVVPVVVLDKKGNPVGGLQQSDFELRDQRKIQNITTFSAETRSPASTTRSSQGHLVNPATSLIRPDPEKVGSPRFVAYLFDDLHLEFADLARAQQAALKNLENMDSGNQIAVFATSGQTVLDFTIDQEKIKAAIQKLKPRTNRAPQCPDIDYYLGEKIINRSDPRGMQVGMIRLASCLPDIPSKDLGELLVTNAAREAYFFGEQMVRVSLSVLQNISRRMAILPGEKSLTFISGGFTSPTVNFEKSALIELAIRSGLIIHTLDARGIYGDSVYNASRGFLSAVSQADIVMENDLTRTGHQAQSNTLAEFAEGTGGMRFFNNNDLFEGFKRLSAPPEHSYILGFEPSDLKANGKFRTLRVRLRNHKGFTVHARKGYYDLRADQLNQYTREAGSLLISGARRQELPIRFTPQLVSLPDGKHQLELVTNLKASEIPFFQVEGMNSNIIMVTFTLFDQTGNIREFITRKVDLNLKDEVLKDLPDGEIQFTTPLGVHSGKFQAQMVAQDSLGQKTTVENIGLDLP